MYKLLAINFGDGKSTGNCSPDSKCLSLPLHRYEATGTYTAQLRTSGGAVLDSVDVTVKEAAQQATVETGAASDLDDTWPIPSIRHLANRQTFTLAVGESTSYLAYGAGLAISTTTVTLSSIQTTGTSSIANFSLRNNVEELHRTISKAKYDEFDLSYGRPCLWARLVMLIQTMNAQAATFSIYSVIPTYGGCTP